MPRILTKLTLFLLPALCCVLLAACSSSTGPANYNVAGTLSDIPTITSVVGDRSFVGSSVTRYANAEEGNLSVVCAYSGSPNVEDDIQRYCDALVENNGFTLQTAYDGEHAVLTAPSSIEGQGIQVTITADDGGYSITAEIMETDTSSAE